MIAMAERAGEMKGKVSGLQSGGTYVGDRASTWSCPIPRSYAHMRLCDDVSLCSFPHPPPS